MVRLVGLWCTDSYKVIPIGDDEIWSDYDELSDVDGHDEEAPNLPPSPHEDTTVSSTALVRWIVAIAEVTIADTLLLQFCRRNEILFGKETITPNMHMSCHLRECILDYGPINHLPLNVLMGY